MQKKRIHFIALAGILAALTTVLLLLGSVFEMIDLSMAALASLVVMVAVVEMNWKWACGVYLIASVLSVLLMPRTAPIVFAGFLGYYPIIKVFLDRIRPIFLQYLTKFACVNCFLAISLFLVWEIVGAESEWFSMTPLLVIVANIAFFLYDFVIAKMSVFYIVKIRKKFRKS